MEQSISSLQAKVSEYESEFKELKNQEVTIRQLEEKIAEYQAMVCTIHFFVFIK